jgi:hypothetical protein
VSTDLNGGAAPSSLDDLVVVETLATTAHDGGAAPQDAADVSKDDDVDVLASSADAGPAPDPDN